MEWFFRRLSLSVKQTLIVGVLIVGTLTMAGVQLSVYYDAVMEGRIQKTRNLVEVVHGVVASAYDMMASQGMDEAAAKQLALKEVRRLRYDGKEYFWINDMRPVMLMHPYVPEMEGKDLRNYRDPEGHLLFRTMVEIVQERGSGVVHYSWSKPGEDKSKVYPKLSFVKGFAPWGWIIGSGIYIDDVRAAFWHKVLWLSGILGIVIFFTAGLAIVVVRGTVRPIHRLARQVVDLAEGKPLGEIDTDREDEIGAIAKALLFLRDKLDRARAAEKRVRWQERRAEQGGFVLRIKEKALTRRVKEKEELERQLQQTVRDMEESKAAAIRAKNIAEEEAKTVALMRRAAATANEANDVDVAIKQMLEMICVFIDWSVGHAFYVDRADNCLRSTRQWYLKDATRYKRVVEMSEGATFSPGDGLSGTAWRKMSPVRTDQLPVDGIYPRRDTMHELGLRMGFALPILANGEAVFVFEFFSESDEKFGEEILSILKEIGGQLVHVLERKRNEESLTLSKKEAEEANAAKSEFLANMSHELRTPLNSILGMLRFLGESKLDEKQHFMVDTAYRSSVGLLETVNDILDLSKIEAGEMTFEHIGFDPKYAMEGIVQVLEPQALEKKLLIVRHYADVDFPYVLGDPTRFGRVLTNLIGNALKYTERGHVEVSAVNDYVDERHIIFRCEISDTGIGIPEGKIASIFEKFVQADTSTTRKYGGSGLGLCITKQLVEFMGGTIGVRSKVGVGSTFFFSIPFEVTDRLHEEKHIRHQKMQSGTILPEKTSILVAEDHLMNQIMMREILQRFGIGRIEIVSNGQEAMDAVEKGGWDIVLMDCHMPQVNGYDATVAIRKREKETGAHIPIVAMTANAMVGDREKCLRYGMDSYVSKPINLEALRDVLAEWVKFDSATPEGGPQEVAADEPAQAADPVNLSQLRSLTEGDVEAEREVMVLFTRQSDINVEGLHAALASGDAKAWRDAAHMFKGGAANIGAAHLAELCDRAQHFDGDEESRLKLLSEIVAAYEAVRVYLRGQGLIN